MMSNIWMVINKQQMSVFGVYDSELKTLCCMENIDSIKGETYYIESQVLR